MDYNNGSYAETVQQQLNNPQGQPSGPYPQPQPGMQQPYPQMQQPYPQMQQPYQQVPPQYAQYGPQGPYPGYPGMMPPHAPAFDRTPHRKFFSRVGLGYFTFYIASAIAQLIVMLAAYKLFPEVQESYVMRIVLSLAPMYFIGAPTLWLVLKKLPAEKPEGKRWNIFQIIGGFFAAYALVYLSNIIGTTLGTIIEGIFPDAQAATNDVQDLVASGNIVVNLIAIVIIGPIVEELLFRKFLCDRIRVYGDGVTMVMSGLVFAIFHGNLTQGAYTFTLGAFFAYVYLKTGRLYITIFYHMAVNFVGGILPFIFLKGLDLKEYMDTVSGGDSSEIWSYIRTHSSSVAMVFGYALFIFGIVAIGIIILILTLARKRVFINGGKIVIPKGHRFSTVIVNVGMILYIVLGIVCVILSMLP